MGASVEDLEERGVDRRRDRLPEPRAVFAEASAKDLVPLSQDFHRTPQGGNLDVATHAKKRGAVVRRRLGVQPLEHPHSALGKRSRTFGRTGVKVELVEPVEAHQGIPAASQRASGPRNAGSVPASVSS